MKVTLNSVSRFAWSMATCLASGLPPRKALELSGGESPALRSIAQAAAEACDQGRPLSDALEPHERLLPHFVLPVIRAGEMGGRHVEAFQLIHQHCERLKPSLEAVRNTWLYPLVCILAGWSIRTGVFLYFGMYQLAWFFVRDTFLTGAVVVLAGWGLLRLRPVRQGVDALLLQIPFIREILVRQAVVLFFATFRLAYEAGGLAVTTVFRVALSAIHNSGIGRDFAKTVPVVEAGGSFDDAFNEPLLLEDSIKSSIAAGALSGQLGTALGQIVKSETLELELALEKFNRIFHRLVAYAVAMSVVGTVLTCVLYQPAGVGPGQ